MVDWRRVARMVLGGVVFGCVWLAAAAVLAGQDFGGVSADLSGLRDGLGRGGSSSGDSTESSVSVRVRSEGCGGAVSGSGFVVDGVLFTNRHVVGDAPVVAISSAANPRVSVDVPVLGRSSRIDAAVAGPVPEALVVDQVVFAEVDAGVGDVVWLVGWVDGQVQRREATVHLFTDGAAYGIDGQVMLIDPATTFGFSGGPVLNEDGEVVGMLQSVDLTTSLTLAIPLSELSSSEAGDINGVDSTFC